jgi:hypothetical protein
VMLQLWICVDSGRGVGATGVAPAHIVSNAVLRSQ